MTSDSGLLKILFFSNLHDLSPAWYGAEQIPTYRLVIARSDGGLPHFVAGALSNGPELG